MIHILFIDPLYILFYKLIRRLNMKKKVLLSTVVFLTGMMVSAASFGSAGALDAGEMDLEAMLKYALEDEHMALAEYEALMKEFNLDRPYSNIIKSEKTHISYLEELYKSYGIAIPVINTKDHLILPASPQEAAEIAVQAEINNIAMYAQFLQKELPADVKAVFENLKKDQRITCPPFSVSLTDRQEAEAITDYSYRKIGVVAYSLLQQPLFYCPVT